MAPHMRAAWPARRLLRRGGCPTPGHPPDRIIRRDRYGTAWGRASTAKSRRGVVGRTANAKTSTCTGGTRAGASSAAPRRSWKTPATAATAARGRRIQATGARNDGGRGGSTRRAPPYGLFWFPRVAAWLNAARTAGRNRGCSATRPGDSTAPGAGGILRPRRNEACIGRETRWSLTVGTSSGNEADVRRRDGKCGAAKPWARPKRSAGRTAGGA